jgi:hypothetical protein
MLVCSTTAGRGGAGELVLGVSFDDRDLIVRASQVMEASGAPSPLAVDPSGWRSERGNERWRERAKRNTPLETRARYSAVARPSAFARASFLPIMRFFRAFSLSIMSTPFR